MFVLCTPQQSDLLLDELIHVEEDMFAQLGLHFKTLVGGFFHACFNAGMGMCMRGERMMVSTSQMYGGMH